jgi:hypothetical protein
MNCISCESWWRIAYQNNIYRFLFILWYELWYSGAKSLKGRMGGNFEVLCRRGHTILLTSDTMRLTDPSRKLCKLKGETWLIYFPARMGRDLTIHRFEKELSSLEDCGELHENETSQVVFNWNWQNNIKIIRSYIKAFHGKIVI